MSDDDTPDDDISDQAPDDQEPDDPKPDDQQPDDVKAPVAGNDADAATAPRSKRSVAVPAWAAGALATLAAVGGGFAIGRATADDNTSIMNDRPASAVSPAQHAPGPTNGRGLPPLPNGGQDQQGGGPQGAGPSGT